MNSATNRGAPDAPALDLVATLGVPLGAASIGVIVFDSSRRMIAINPAAEQLLQQPAAELLGKTATVLGAAFDECIRETLARSGSITCEVPGVSQSQHALTVSTSLSKSPSGETSVVLAHVQSDDRLRSVAANLEQLDQLAGLGAVTAGVAHEIKNALVAVRAFFDLLAMGECDPELKEVAAAEVQRIERAVRQLLTGARRGEGKWATLSVHTLIEDTIMLVRRELQTRGVTAELHLQARNDRVHGDERQIRQMIVNLLVNAAEAMTEGGRLTISTEVVEALEREHVRITIIDTGTGIAPENLARIFSPFFTTKPNGTGLGLAISHRVATSHNGSLRVESKLGQGTTFRIMLPLYRHG